MRMLDLIAPIGKGQRGMIVSQPKTGKTTLLKQVAKAVTTNYPKMKLIVLLIDERPEEVTDIKESIEGEQVEVIYSTFDELPENHKRVSEMVIEHAKRLVESGEDMAAAGIREMYEETGLSFTPVDAGACSRPFFTTIGMTDESCGTVFGYCSGEPTSAHQESSEDIQVILADRAECRRILREENVAIMCAYMLMHFIAGEGDPLAFLQNE